MQNMKAKFLKTNFTRMIQREIYEIDQPPAFFHLNFTVTCSRVGSSHYSPQNMIIEL